MVIFFFEKNDILKTKSKKKKIAMYFFRRVFSYKKLRRRSETLPPGLDQTAAECPKYFVQQSYNKLLRKEYFLIFFMLTFFC